MVIRMLTPLVLLGSAVLLSADDSPTPEAASLGGNLVEARAAGYYPLSTKAVELKGTEAILVAGKTSPVRLRFVRSLEEWKAFSDEFLRDDDGGEPGTSFVPDFDRDVLLVYFQPAAEAGRPFGDVEVYEAEGELRAFVFFWTGEEAESAKGRFVMRAVPRRLADKPVILRVGYQSWGRVCSRFSAPLRLAATRAVP